MAPNFDRVSCPCCCLFLNTGRHERTHFPCFFFSIVLSGSGRCYLFIYLFCGQILENAAGRFAQRGHHSEANRQLCVVSSC